MLTSSVPKTYPKPARLCDHRRSALTLPVTSDGRLGWFAELATTVAQAHAAGLLHGQLQPEHVLFAGDGEHVKVLGFEPPSWREIRHGPKRGDAHALRKCRPLDAPELQGKTHATTDVLERADMWGLGVLLTAILVEQPPCVTGGRDASQPISVKLPAAMQSAPAGISTIVDLLLRPNPLERPTSSQVQEAAQMLLATRGEQSLTTHSFATLKRSPKAHASSSSLGKRHIEMLTMERSDSTISTLSDLSEAPTRNSSLLEMVESAPVGSTPASARLGALFKELRHLEARPLLQELSGHDGAAELRRSVG